MIATHHLAEAFVLLPGTLRLGLVRVPVFGLIAACGLVLAMLASQPSARRARVSPQAAWDAGLFAIMAGFIASRLLLILRDPASFRRMPLLVLSLPSLTYLGLLVAALATLIYLWRRPEPLLAILDAWAVPGALLAAVLELAHWIEGTGAGMPSHLPWAMRSAGDGVLGPVEPTQLFGALAALVLGAILWSRLTPERTPGSVAALALFAGGLLSFAIDQLRQPMETFGDDLLEPGEWIALGAALCGAALLLFGEQIVAWKRARHPSPTPSASAERPTLQEAR